MFVARRVMCCISFAMVVAAGPGCHPAGRSGTSPHDKLANFEGSIDWSKQTYDTAKSDLHIRAARALKAGDVAAAEALYRQGVAMYPADPSAYTSLAACLFFQARYEESRAEYGRALDLDSRCAGALYGLGCIGYEQGRYEEARDNLIRALEAQEVDGRTHRVLALVYDQLGDRAKARTHYERAAALDPAIAGEEHVRKRLEEPPP
jgi:Flp pilus assembly protein TadD